MEWQPFWLTAKLAFFTTLILFVLAVPLAHWLSRKKGILQIGAQALVTMPLILPPSVIGFYLLIAFSPGHWFGHLLLRWLDLRLVFSFPGLLVASCIYSFPFMVHPIQSGLESLPASLRESAALLGKSGWQILTRVLLPNIKSSILTAVILTFAHTVGEFGVVLMIGGNIPGSTRVASVAIFDEVESFHYAQANQYALILMLTSFVVLLSMYLINRKLHQPVIP